MFALYTRSKVAFHFSLKKKLHFILILEGNSCTYPKKIPIFFKGSVVLVASRKENQCFHSCNISPTKKKLVQYSKTLN